MKFFTIFIFFFAFLFFNKKIVSQILHVNPSSFTDKIFSSDSHFNPLFIRRNKIKSIKNSISIKEDMREIQETPLFHEYFFNDQGVLIKQLETYYRIYLDVDTILTIYNYNTNGQIISEIKKDNKGYFTYKYTYNSDQLLQSYTYTKSKNFPDGKNELVIFRETYQYLIHNDSVVKRELINDIGKAYKAEGFYYNEIGRLNEKYNNLITSKIGKIYNYSYNDFGRVLKLQIQSLPTKKDLSEIMYTYDNLGNLMTETLYKKNKKHIHNEFIYDQHLLLKAQLSKQEETGRITIYKFKYVF